MVVAVRVWYTVVVAGRRSVGSSEGKRIWMRLEV